MHSARRWVGGLSSQQALEPFEARAFCHLLTSISRCLHFYQYAKAEASSSSRALEKWDFLEEYQHHGSEDCLALPIRQFVKLIAAMNSLQFDESSLQHSFTLHISKPGGKEKLSPITHGKLISLIMHNASGPAGATRALLFIAAYLLHKPQHGFCDELCNTMCSKSPLLVTEGTSTSGSFHKLQHKLQAATVQAQTLTFALHPNTHPLLLEAVIKLAQFLRLKARATRSHRERTSPPAPAISPTLALSGDQQEKSQALHREQQQHQQGHQPQQSKARASYTTGTAPVVVPQTQIVYKL